MYFKNLSYDDIETLKEWGFLGDDIRQIDKAVTKTVYQLEDKKISHKKAREILGDKEFLSGIARSAFHFDAVRKTDKQELLLFDSSKLFKTNERGR